MGSIKFTKYDRNRFRKTYPRFRVLPNEGYRSNGEMAIEAMEVEFTNQSTIKIQLNEDYTTAPTVTVTPYQKTTPAGTNEVANINVYVESVVLTGVPPGGRKAIVTLRTSEDYTGTIFLQAIQVGS